jgi:hypothetical protein
VEFVKKETNWSENLRLDWEDKIKPYALKQGAKTFGAIGKRYELIFKGTAKSQ